MARFNQLQRVRVLSHSLTSASWLFGVVFPRLEAVEMECAGITDFSRMFSDNLTAPLRSIDLGDTSSGTRFDGMFSNCWSLQTVPAFDTSSGTRFDGMFNLCQSMQTVPLLDTSSGTDFLFMFISCRSLSKVGITSWPVPESEGTYGSIFTQCYLSAASLNQIYTSLPDLTELELGFTPYISVSGNYGTEDEAHDPTIATAKGWEVYY
jgi:hypothetical protein